MCHSSKKPANVKYLNIKLFLLPNSKIERRKCMVVIRGFKGYRYNADRVKYQDIITPPYDVIDADMKKQLAASSPYNFVHVILNEDHARPNELLNSMVTDGILKQDIKDSLYVYEQQYTAHNRRYIRTGFICLVKLEDFGKNILPHERTFEKHIADRYDLMCKTKSDVGQIFLVYEDEKNAIDSILETQKSRPEDMAFADQDENTHKLWCVSDPETVAMIVSSMESKPLLMADGHHRYKTALRYSKEHSEKEYVMTTLVNAYNEGLVILPTNRILNIPVDITVFQEKFTVETLDSFDFEQTPRSFVVADTKNKHRVTLKSGYENELDVVILHDLVFDTILKLTEEQLTQPNIEFVKGNELTVQKITEGKTAFFVNPPTLKQTFEIAQSDRVMPQKSTFFYPKVYSGFVLNRWE